MGSRRTTVPGTPRAENYRRPCDGRNDAGAGAALRAPDVPPGRADGRRPKIHFRWSERTFPLIRRMATTGVRNKMREAPAGIVAVIGIGDYSDVAPVEAHGCSIPWNRLSLSGDEAMRDFMRQVVNRMHTSQARLDEPRFLDGIAIRVRRASRRGGSKIDGFLQQVPDPPIAPASRSGIPGGVRPSAHGDRHQGFVALRETTDAARRPAPCRVSLSWRPS